MFDVEIRRLTLAELARLSGAAEGVFEGDWDSDRIGRYVSTPGHIMIVAVNGSEVVGQVAAVLHHHPDRPVDLYIDDLVVGLGYRRRSLGRKLVQAMMDVGVLEGCRTAWVVTERRQYRSSRSL